MQQTLSGKQISVLLVLVVLLATAGITANTLYRNKYVTEYSVKDPDSGQTVLYNSSRNPTADQSSVLILSSQRLLDLGMTSGQYVALNKSIIDTVSKTYGKKYTKVSVNTDSIAYDEVTGTYSFKARLGEIGSKNYLSVSATTEGEDTLRATIKGPDGTLLKDSSVRAE